MVLEFTNIEELVRIASQAKENAYCPYSNFRVGAALVTESGEIYTGCNVENACYPVGNCAERTAIVKAVSEGHRLFKAIAVITDKAAKIMPCGLCRQSLIEFSKDLVVYIASVDLTFRVTTLSELLPHGFTAEDLN
ncbi:cytidine deaminase-like isoform X2 [Clavelina lepadiformis]|uniref:cytidine deaminase-like isoform X1 n=1 Tax=Clavelina lepadiformis TaxID=159417 RepID=UPI0040438680